MVLVLDEGRIRQSLQQPLYVVALSYVLELHGELLPRQLFKQVCCGLHTLVNLPLTSTVTRCILHHGGRLDVRLLLLVLLLVLHLGLVILISSRPRHHLVWMVLARWGHLLAHGLHVGLVTTCSIHVRIWTAILVLSLIHISEPTRPY